MSHSTHYNIKYTSNIHQKVKIVSKTTIIIIYNRFRRRLSSQVLIPFISQSSFIVHTGQSSKKAKKKMVY
jgi:hypothetical protein